MNNTTQMPLISIIVPVYNTAKYLEQCLASICSQTLHDIEILCVNDGSTDDSESIIKKFNSRDSRIHLVNQENLGPCEARKHGIRLARGQYIGFVDSDDYVADDFFASLYAVACKENADIVATASVFTFANNYSFLQKESAITENTPSLSSQERAKLFLITASPCNKIYRANLCQNLLPYYLSRGKEAEDNMFSIPAHILAKKFSVTTHGKYFYRQHDESICHQSICLSAIFNVYKMYSDILSMLHNFKLNHDDYRIYKKHILRRRNSDCYRNSENLPSLADQLSFVWQTHDLGFQIPWLLRKLRSIWRSAVTG